MTMTGRGERVDVATASVARPSFRRSPASIRWSAAASSPTNRRRRARRDPRRERCGATRFAGAHATRSGSRSCSTTSPTRSSASCRRVSRFPCWRRNQIDVWLPPTAGRQHVGGMVGRLRTGITIDAANTELAGIARAHQQRRGARDARFRCAARRPGDLVGFSSRCSCSPSRSRCCSWSPARTSRICCSNAARAAARARDSGRARCRPALDR